MSKTRLCGAAVAIMFVIAGCSANGVRATEPSVRLSEQKIYEGVDTITKGIDYQEASEDDEGDGLEITLIIPRQSSKAKRNAIFAELKTEIQSRTKLHVTFRAPVEKSAILE